VPVVDAPDMEGRIPTVGEHRRAIWCRTNVTAR